MSESTPGWSQGSQGIPAQRAQADEEDVAGGVDSAWRKGQQDSTGLALTFVVAEVRVWNDPGGTQPLRSNPAGDISKSFRMSMVKLCKWARAPSLGGFKNCHKCTLVILFFPTNEAGEQKCFSACISGQELVTDPSSSLRTEGHTSRKGSSTLEKRSLVLSEIDLGSGLDFLAN